jgi:hypothetical protein
MARSICSLTQKSFNRHSDIAKSVRAVSCQLILAASIPGVAVPVADSPASIRAMSASLPEVLFSVPADPMA